jgi:transposase
MTAILGLDISKDHVDAVLLRDDQPSQYAQFTNNASGFKKLWQFLHKRQAKSVHACMEATGLYYEAVADFLADKGATVSVVNPARIKAYAASQMTRNKTDKLDAQTIADFCRTQNPAPWTPPSPAWRHLRTLARHLEDLQSDRQRQRNRQHAYERASTPVQPVLDNLQRQIDMLTDQIEQIQQAMDDHIDQYPDLKNDRDLIASISGIGNLTANKLLAEFHDIRQFDDVRQLVAFAGLNPRQNQSGSSVRGRTPISKMGRPALRAILYMPAVVAKRHNPILRAHAQRLAERGLCEMEIIVVLMRKLLHLVYGVLKSGQPFDPNFLEKSVANA